MARPTPVISEFVFNHVGADTREYIEVEGAASTDASSLTLLVIDGDAGAPLGNVTYRSPALGVTDADGLISTGFLDNALQNGTQTLLLVSDYTGTSSLDLDADDDGALDSAPWSRILDGVAVSDGGADDRTYAGVPVLLPGYDGSSITVGGASRLPAGAADTDGASDFARNDFDLAGIDGFPGTPGAGEALNTPAAVNRPAVEAAPVAAVQVSPVGIAAAEGGATGVLTVRLATQPTANVVVPLAADAQVSISAASLTFTPATFSTAQSVTVTAVNDVAVEGAHAGLVTTGAAASTDPAYSGLDPADVSVAITDNDSAPPVAVAIRDIQGAGHRSPLLGQGVSTSGIVTAIRGAGGFGPTGVAGFWVQDPRRDADVATSEAVFVHASSAAQLAQIEVGHAVQVDGTVEEFLPGNIAANLSVTRLANPALTVLSAGNPLPAATLIGAGGRFIPNQAIYDDAPGNLNAGIGDFDPAAEGIDFFESLEGMRVTVRGGVGVGPTNTFNETYILANNGAEAGPRNARGGITLTETDANPERIQVQTVAGVRSGPADVPLAADVGDRLGRVTGVISYDFGNFELIPTGAVEVRSGGLQREVSPLRGDHEHLLFAEWNVENLDPSDATFDDLAAVIGGNLNSPDIIALQEIQDSNGAVNNGVTDAAATGQALIDALQVETGITYAYADIAPANGTSGGEPGGNIRNAFLYREDRVQLVPGSLRQVLDTEATPGNAFASSRIPLVADFTFGPTGQTITAISVHSSSKGGGTPLFGSVQPSVNGGEAARVAQATEIKAFVDGLLAQDPDAKVVAAGDFNEFNWEDPQRVLLGGADPTLFDPQDLEPVAERYTYVFEGNSQALDHTLVTAALLPLVQYDTVHVTAEFSGARNISDHDPSLTRIDLSPGTLGLTSSASFIGAASSEAVATGSDPLTEAVELDDARYADDPAPPAEGFVETIDAGAAASAMGALEAAPPVQATGLDLQAAF